MDKENKIKTGDLVRLKSGGSIMTVGDVSGEDITCTWFIHGECRMWKFKEDQLVEITEITSKF